MRFYPAGETITQGLLDLPHQRVGWVITGADVDDVIAAGFQRHQADQTRFVHAESGDIYQLVSETDHISSVTKAFYETLGDRADKVFNSFGLDALI